MHAFFESASAHGALCMAATESCLAFGLPSGGVRVVPWRVPSSDCADAHAVTIHESHAEMVMGDKSVECLVASPWSRDDGTVDVAAFVDGSKVIRVAIGSHSGGVTVHPQSHETVSALELPYGCEYTTRCSAHCWIDLERLLVGCFNGAVVYCDFVSHTCSIIVEEDSPIVQLFYGAATQQLVVSSLRRSSTQPSLMSPSGEQVRPDVKLQQIGTKNRDEGYFGACYVGCAIDKVYATRHNHRFFEANRDNGVVEKTFKVSDDVPLGLIRPLRLEGAQADDEAVLWSEGPTFCAVVLLSPAAGSQCLWRLDCGEQNGQGEGAPVANYYRHEVFLCSAPTLHFQFALTSLGRILVAAFDVCAESHGWNRFSEGAKVAPAPIAEKDSTIESYGVATSAADGPHSDVLAVTAPIPDAHKSTTSDVTSLSPDVMVTVVGDADTPVEQVVKPVKTRKVNIVKKVSIVKKKVTKKEASPAVEDDESASLQTSLNVDGASDRSTSRERQGTTAAEDLLVVASVHGCDAQESAADEQAESLPPSPSIDVAHVPPRGDDALCQSATVKDATVIQGDSYHSHVSHDEKPEKPHDDAPKVPVEPSNGVPEMSKHAAKGERHDGAETELHASLSPLAFSNPSTSQVPPEVPVVDREALFHTDLTRLYRSYCARQLDKKSQPALRGDIVTFFTEHTETLRELVLVGSSGGILQTTQDQVVVLLRAGIEWTLHLANLEADDVRAATVRRLATLLLGIRGLEKTERADVCESIVKTLGYHEPDHAWLNELSADAMQQWYPQAALPRFMGDGAVTNANATGVKQLLPMERLLISGDSASVLDTLSLMSAPTCALRQYFPYLFAALPSKALQAALGHFPTLSLRYLHWSLSGEAQSAAVEGLRRAGGGAQLERMSLSELDEAMSDIVLLLLQDHKETLQASSTAFPRAIQTLLQRRHAIIHSPATTTPLLSRSTSVSSTQKKLKRIVDAVLDLLKSTTWADIHSAHPCVTELLLRYEFPEAIAEIPDGIDRAVQMCIAEGRIDNLLPLYSLPSPSITESHWVRLFTKSLEPGLLMAAVFLCLGVLQQPKRARLLLRRAFPFLDSPDLADEQLKTVVAKLSGIIGAS